MLTFNKVLSFALLVLFVSTNSLAQKWSKVGIGKNTYFNGGSRALLSDKQGNIYTAGAFTDSITSLYGYSYVSKFDGISWQKLGAGNNSLKANVGINTLTIDKNNFIYAAGGFTDSTDWTNANARLYVAKWDGSKWSPLGTGVNALLANGTILCLTNDSSGNIYAAGLFTNSLGNQYVAKWDGNQWAEVGGLNALHANYIINALATDKTGNVYAAGSFTNGASSTQGYNYVAKWDGNNWSELGASSSNPLNANSGINSMVIDSKNNIYVAGHFTDSLSYQKGTCYVAKWDGNQWSKLPFDTALYHTHYIYYNGFFCLTVDNADNIYAGGMIKDSIGQNTILKWDGNQWSSSKSASFFTYVNTKPNPRVHTLITDKWGSVYAAGNLSDSLNTYFVARYGFPLGVENIKERKNELVVYPNPVGSQLSVYSNQFEVNTIEVTDVLGRTLKTISNIQSSITNIQIDELPSGIYFIKATDSKRNIMNGKFVKE
jgi:hypothetical protein